MKCKRVRREAQALTPCRRETLPHNLSEADENQFFNSNKMNNFIFGHPLPTLPLAGGGK